jgi:hypothetical protein
MERRRSVPAAARTALANGDVQAVAKRAGEGAEERAAAPLTAVDTAASGEAEVSTQDPSDGDAKAVGVASEETTRRRERAGFFTGGARSSNRARIRRR